MGARRRLRGDLPPKVRAAARETVQATKVALGERGPVWWSDGSPDLNHRLARNTPYAAWFESLQTTNTSSEAGRASERS